MINKKCSEVIFGRISYFGRTSRPDLILAGSLTDGKLLQEGGCTSISICCICSGDLTPVGMIGMTVCNSQAFSVAGWSAKPHCAMYFAFHFVLYLVPGIVTRWYTDQLAVASEWTL